MEVSEKILALSVYAGLKSIYPKIKDEYNVNIIIFMVVPCINNIKFFIVPN